MNHQPTQLALLISLIGIGVTPHANASANISARLDARGVDGLALDAIQRPLHGVTCTELEAGALPACGAHAELTWLPPGDPLDRIATAGVRVLYSTGVRDDWAPGEVSVEAAGESARFGHWVPRDSGGPAAKDVDAARAPVRQSSRQPSTQAAGKHAGKTTRKVRVLAQLPASAREKMPPLAQGDASSARIEVLKRATQVAEAVSTQADRLSEGVVAVEAPSARVLRQLDAILSEERDEVGASRLREQAAAVTNHGAKVLDMLGEIVAPPPPVEDGPARRLRKLAARDAKADAKAIADAAAALAAEIARDGVDLVLPLEPPSLASASAPVALPSAAPAPAPAPAGPAPHPARAHPFGEGRMAIAEASLDRVRGGFFGDGLSISFGIERAVYVNGALVTTTSLNVSDLGRITAGRGTAAFDVGTIGLIQSGAGNVVSPTMISAGSAGTVIQNTLDGQKIQNVTIINATTNSLGLLRGLNLQSSLRGAVIDSLRR